MNDEEDDYDDDGLEERLAAFRQSDMEREELLKKTRDDFRQLRKTYKDLLTDHKIQVQYNRHLQQRFDALQQLFDAQNTRPLVGVFLDGDGAIFRPELIQKGVQGGDQAAHEFLTVIKDHLKQLYPAVYPESWKVMAFVAASMDGLGKALQRNGIVTYFNKEIREFAIGFNKGASRTFSFIDVGYGKELADFKIKDLLEAMLPVCKHVFFAGCHDSGYIPFLNPYKREPSIASKITLIETTPARPEFAQLGFKMVRFPTVFRSDDLLDKKEKDDVVLGSPTTPGPPPNAQAALSASPAPSRATQNSGNLPVQPAQSGSNWASLGNSVPPSTSINIAPAKASKSKPKYIVVNASDERVDLPLPRYDPAAELRFQAKIKVAGGKNFCNHCNFYGREGCIMDERFQHGKAKLTQDEFVVLQHKVRNIKCLRGSWCEDPRCPFSHHCRRGKDCELYDCRFADTHYMDTRPATKIYDDGTTEPFKGW